MKKIFLFTILSFTLILSSCRKDEEIKLNSNICLKLSDGTQLFEYDEFNRIKEIYYYESDNKRYTGTSFSYSGDTIIKEYQVPGPGSGSFVTEKTIIGENGFIQKTFHKIYNFQTGTREYSDSNVYDEYKFLIKTIGYLGITTYFFYEINGNLKEEWRVNGVDSFLSKKYEYDLLNENKEASWQEWVNRKGKASKNLLVKEIQGNHLYEYSYFLKNGYPITKQVRYSYIDPILNGTNFYNLTWSCLK